VPSLPRPLAAPAPAAPTIVAPDDPARPSRFLWATGIENSYPTIAGPDGRPRRVDQLAKGDHYARWREDFALVRELGLRTLRWGPPYYRTHVGPDRYDWSLVDEPLHALRALGVTPILDLCHFGVPDWLGGFQDPAFPVLFAEYARQVARRHPWVRHWTPVNEIFVCASFSALRGWWNEREASDRAFATALRNLCMAHELAVEAIQGEVPDAVFVQAESIEWFHPATRAAAREASRWNGLARLSLDLTTGTPPEPGMAAWLHAHGVSSTDLAFFRERRAVGRRWLGTDYYETCEHRVHADGGQETERVGTLGYARLARRYWRRYGLPIFHCETNHADGVAVDWLHRQWQEVERLRTWGIPVVGFTWFSLCDQIDWQHALRVERDDLHPVGLYDLQRRERPVGAAYRALVARHAALPAWPERSEEKAADAHVA
jgi:beta-glucosidase/6-phospho-beta-glucosidase/beta-galactosidase